MIKEAWLPIIGYEGLYEVSNHGRVRSLGHDKNHKGKILKPILFSTGYLMVSLSKNNIAKRCSIHRLVAIAFIPNPNRLPCVNHRDQNRQNNYVTNLEWCSYRYNDNYGTRNENISVSLTNHPSKSKRVGQYTLEDILLQTFLSTMDVQRKLGFFNTRISACCRGKQKTAYGYIWKYLD